MPPILDVTIGLLFVYLLFSLIVTAARELCAAFTSSSWDKRAELLKEGIGELLCDDNGKNAKKNLSEEFYNHPLIKALSPNKDNAQPNYIPRETFVSTLLDLIARPNPYGSRTAEHVAAGIVGSLKSNFVERAMIALSELSRKYPGDADITACFTAFDSVASDSAQRNNFTIALSNLKAKIVVEITAAATTLTDSAAAASNAS